MCLAFPYNFSSFFRQKCDKFFPQCIHLIWLRCFVSCIRKISFHNHAHYAHLRNRFKYAIWSLKCEASSSSESKIKQQKNGKQETVFLKTFSTTFLLFLFFVFCILVKLQRYKFWSAHKKLYMNSITLAIFSVSFLIWCWRVMSLQKFWAGAGKPVYFFWLFYLLYWGTV